MTKFSDLLKEYLELYTAPFIGQDLESYRIRMQELRDEMDAMIGERNDHA
jgi:hypothetical protein